MLAQKISKRLSELEMSKYELAKRSGFSLSYISLICSGERGNGMTLETACKLSRVLKVEFSFFEPSENVTTSDFEGLQKNTSDVSA